MSSSSYNQSIANQLVPSRTVGSVFVACTRHATFCLILLLSFFCSPLTLANTARPNRQPPSRAAINIIAAKRMPFRTRSFTKTLPRDGIATMYVFNRRDNFQMNRIHTLGIFTQMVSLVSIWDVIDEQFAKQSVSTPSAPNRLSQINFSVTGCRRPYPTSITFVKVCSRDIDVREKLSEKLSSNFDRLCSSHCGFTSFVKFQLVRLGESVSALRRAVFILT